MKKKSLDTILRMIPSLNYADTKRLNSSIKDKLNSDVVGKVISDREDTVYDCPHCHSLEFVKHGATAKGIQRYRCKTCEKTFCSLTKTPLCRMRKEHKWLDYVSMMWEGVALRTIAKALDISLRSAFFWRHRFLQLPDKKSLLAFQALSRLMKRSYGNPTKARGGCPVNHVREAAVKSP